LGHLSNALVGRVLDHGVMPRELDKPTERRLQRWILEQRYDQLRQDLRRDGAEKPVAREGSPE
jgi:hypothetical protein